MCSAWADAFGNWATAIEPYSSQMIYRKGKVNRLPRRTGDNNHEESDIGLIQGLAPPFTSPCLPA